MQAWQLLGYGVGYLLAVIGLLDVLLGLWKCFVRRTSMGKMLLLARLDGDESQVEGQMRALLRAIEPGGHEVRLMVTASQPRCMDILQRMERGGAPIQVCTSWEKMLCAKQEE